MLGNQTYFEVSEIMCNMLKLDLLNLAPETSNISAALLWKHVKSNVSRQIAKLVSNVGN